MKYNYLLSSLLIGASIVLFQTQSATAQSSSLIAKQAKQITVLIDSNNSKGSEVIINNSGDNFTVLTAGKFEGKKVKYEIIPPNIRLKALKGLRRLLMLI